MVLKNVKKVTAWMLSAALVFGVSSVASADSSGGTGNGELEGTVSTDVFSVKLPTVTEGSEIFNFILDPEGLIDKTSAEKYGGTTAATFEADATVFFKNADGNYTSKSDALTAYNLSSGDVDISVTAAISNASGISMKDTNDFTDDTDTTLYLALAEDATGGAESAITNDANAELSSTINAAPADAYEYSYSDADGYTYALKNDITSATDDADLDTAGFSKYTFYLTGACNTAADWSGLTAATPKVDVTWTIENPYKTTPGIAKTSYDYTAGSDLAIVASLGSGETAATGIKSVSFAASETGAYSALTKGTQWSFSDSKLTLSGLFGAATSGAVRYIKVTFDDAAATTVILTLTIA